MTPDGKVFSAARPARVLKAATTARADVEERWKQAIRDAAEEGMTQRAIAPLAGISHQRVAQILDGN